MYGSFTTDIIILSFFTIHELLNPQEEQMVKVHRMVSVFYAVVLIALMAITACNQQQADPVNTGPGKIGDRGIIHKASDIVITERDVSSDLNDKDQKDLAERLDTHGLLYTGKVVVDNDPKLLEPMKHIAPLIKGDFVLAKEPPEIEFAVIPATPLFLGKPYKKSTFPGEKATLPYMEVIFPDVPSGRRSVFVEESKIIPNIYAAEASPA